MFSVSSRVSCVHRDSQSPAPLHPGSTPTLRAYWLTDADESFGIERHFMILSLQVRFVTSSSLKKLFIIIIVCVIHGPIQTGFKRICRVPLLLGPVLPHMHPEPYVSGF